MKVGSLFAGIGGFDLGFEQAGHTTIWQVEIDAKCRQVLDRHFPHAERHIDVRTVGKHNLAPVDVICGGFPCQDLSVAGRRAGLDGDRSGLFFELARVVAELRPPLFVVENVPGLLSSHEGRDFETVLWWLEELGYGLSWRLLDSRYFGVAQRRRRVFIVGSLGNLRSAEILFEPESLCWDSAKSPKARARVASLAQGSLGSGGADDNDAQAGTIIPTLSSSGAGTARTGNERTEAEMLIAYPLRTRAGINGSPERSDQTLVAAPLTAGGHPNSNRPGRHREDDENIVCVDRAQITHPANRSKPEPQAPALHSEALIAFQAKASPSSQAPSFGPIAPTLDVGKAGSVCVGVRRLTPTECERLQGFPDGWTEGHADSTRYKMLGNAVTVSVARWIGLRMPIREAA